MNDELRDVQERFGLSDENIEQFHRCFVFIAQKNSVDADTREAETAEGERRLLSEDNSERRREAAVDGPRPWESTAHITLSNKNFFDALGCANGKFFDALFDLVSTKDFHAIEFHEFLQVVLTFGFFNHTEIIGFFFFALDKKRSGRIARTQLLRFVEAIHGRKWLLFETAILPKDDESSTRTSNNVRLPAAEERRSTVDREALTRMCAEHPLMLEPICRLQTQLRRRLLGEKWWANQELLLKKRTRFRDRENESKRKQEEKRLLRERSEAIRTEIGLIQFLFRGKAWREADTSHPRPIVTVDKSGEMKVDWTRTRLC